MDLANSDLDPESGKSGPRVWILFPGGIAFGLGSDLGPENPDPGSGKSGPRSGFFSDGESHSDLALTQDRKIRTLGPENPDLGPDFFPAENRIRTWL